VRARLPYVDSLRAIAALSVLAYHAAFVLGGLGSSGAGPWLQELNLGVVLFFAISGFLLYRPFALARVSGAPAPSVREYARRRVLRIVPAYWVALTLIAVAVGRSEVFTAEGIATYYGFAQGFRADTIVGGIGQAWTLGVEACFYAFLPLLAALMRRVRARDPRGAVRSELAMIAALFALSVAYKALVITFVDVRGDAYFPLIISLPGQLDHFAMGMALAVATVAPAGAEPRAARLVRRAPAVPWLVAAAAFALLGAEVVPGGALARGLADHALQGLVALGLMLPAVIGTSGGGAVRRLLGRRELAWVGLVSYGVYLWHLDVLRELADAGLPGPAVVALGLALSLGLGAASWYGIERRWVRRRTWRRGPARGSTPAL
jgi:peptidoglycan/LPS O-acetylase OafA/YrhL